ncbi:MAG: glutamate--tRNA ligase, partial [Deltaproteobacteria bacterium]|nr:glutamate--tRNA ligase [Deltaproteobacteria bacterium]
MASRSVWKYGDQEIFSTEELVDKFTLDNVGKSAGVFNPEKLMWLNSHYIKEKPPEEVAGLLTPFLTERGITTPLPPDMLTKAVVTLQTRARTLIEMAEGAAFYFQDTLEYDPAAAKKFLTPELVPVFDALLDKLALVDAFKEEELEEIFRTMAESLGLKLGKIAQPVRV